MCMSDRGSSPSWRTGKQMASRHALSGRIWSTTDQIYHWLARYTSVPFIDAMCLAALWGFLSLAFFAGRVPPIVHYKWRNRSWKAEQQDKKSKTQSVIVWNTAFNTPFCKPVSRALYFLGGANQKMRAWACFRENPELLRNATALSASTPMRKSNPSCWVLKPQIRM